jgi:hypothetical protein
MSKRILLVLSALLAAGCFFGGEGETSTEPDKVDPKDTIPKAKLIVPGVYTGDYTWIDSNNHGLESEFVLDANGKYRLFWISENEAVYDQRGNWHQKDSNFYFNSITDAWVYSGVFDNFSILEDDTNAVIGVTDTSFTRREYTPLRQKPYWITYHKVNYPSLKDGEYRLAKSIERDSIQVTYIFKIKLTGNDFLFSLIEDSVESFQSAAKFYQAGSFLVTEENQQREIDSTNTFPATWIPVDGAILKRLQSVSDTTFNMWNPPSLFEAGSWDIYNKNLK